MNHFFPREKLHVLFSTDYVGGMSLYSSIKSKFIKWPWSVSYNRAIGCSCHLVTNTKGPSDLQPISTVKHTMSRLANKLMVSDLVDFTSTSGTTSWIYNQTNPYVSVSARKPQTQPACNHNRNGKFCLATFFWLKYNPPFLILKWERLSFFSLYLKAWPKCIL